jgi:hypothetical protein
MSSSLREFYYVEMNLKLQAVITEQHFSWQKLLRKARAHVGLSSQ